MIDESLGLDFGYFPKTIISNTKVLMFTKENIKKGKYIKFQKF
jgi:hypothetical protein